MKEQPRIFEKNERSEENHPPDSKTYRTTEVVTTRRYWQRDIRINKWGRIESSETELGRVEVQHISTVTLNQFPPINDGGKFVFPCGNKRIALLYHSGHKSQCRGILNIKYKTTVLNESFLQTS